MSSSAYLVVDTKNTISLATHPDNFVVNHVLGYGIEVIRSLAGWCYRKPFTRSYKLVLVQQAQNLGVEAQNALLKPLEEPPASTSFILTIAHPSQLLPTILSRCTTLSKDEFKAYEWSREILLSKNSQLNTLSFPLITSEKDAFTQAEVYSKHDRNLIVASVEEWCMVWQSNEPVTYAPLVRTALEVLLHIKANGNIRLNLEILFLAIAK